MQDRRQLTIGPHEDSRKHLLVYLFATLLPFYRTSISGYRDFLAMILALTVIVSLFLYLRLHYVNIYFAMAGYRAYTVHSPDGDNPYTGTEPIVLLSSRHILHEGQDITAHRITDTVYLEYRQ